MFHVPEYSSNILERKSEAVLPYLFNTKRQIIFIGTYICIYIHIFNSSSYLYCSKLLTRIYHQDVQFLTQPLSVSLPTKAQTASTICRGASAVLVFQEFVATVAFFLPRNPCFGNPINIINPWLKPNKSI